MDPVAFLAGLVALAAASSTDFKTREVPDLLSYGFIAFAVAYGLGRGALEASWAPVLAMLLGALVMLLLGALMFYGHQWGGADSKLLIGIGALLGLTAARPAALHFLLVALLAGALYGLGYTLLLAAKHWGAFKPAFLATLRRPRVTMARRVVLAGCFGLLFLLVFTPEYRVPLFLLLVTAYLLFYLWLLVRVVERAVLIKEYPVGKLTEGDWIQEPVVVRGRTVAGPKDLGISKAQIAELKRLKVKKVVVKEGIPFVPSFLVAWVAYWFVADAVAAFFAALF